MKRIEIEENVRRILPILSFIDKESVDRYLNKYGVDLNRDIVHCQFCNVRITHENIGIFMVSENKLIFVCNKKECQEKFSIFRSLEIK